MICGDGVSNLQSLSQFPFCVFCGQNHFRSGGHARLQLVLAFGVEEAVGAVVVGLGHKDARGTIQVAVVGLRGVFKFLGRGDAVLFEHRDEHLGVHQRAGVKQLHARSVARRRANDEGLTAGVKGKKSWPKNFGQWHQNGGAAAAQKSIEPPAASASVAAQ